MSWRDGLALALRSIIRRPARTALTILGIGLGSGLLVALVAIGQVADTQVIGQLGKGGPTTAITVIPATALATQLGSDNAQQGGAPKPIGQDTVTAIQKQSGVTSVLSVVTQSVYVVPGPRGAAIPRFDGEDPDQALPRPFFDNIVGVDLAHVTSLPVTLTAGRLPTPGSTTEVAVTAGYLDKLHLDTTKPAAVLGTEIELGAPQVGPDASHVRSRWTRAVVTAVVAQDVGSGTILVSQELASTDRSWQLQGMDGNKIGLPLPTSAYSGLVVVADSLDTIHTVRAEITTLGFATSAPEHLIASVQRYLHVVDIVLGSIGTIALVIAALGIANSLLSAVRERRREIGVLKAIGARDGDVLRWFLVEAAVCGLVGGILGTAFGLTAVAVTAQLVDSYLLQQGLAAVNLGGVPVATAMVGVFGSMFLALVAAAWPALRAARLPAREAVGAL